MTTRKTATPRVHLTMKRMSSDSGYSYVFYRMRPGGLTSPVARVVTMKRSLRISLVAAAALLLPAAVHLATVPAHAQAAATVRNLSGDVTDKAGNKVKGAVVHLKDTRSLSQRSYITAEDGTFRFGQLSTTTDYEVWADLDGKKSASKTVSSFDTKKAVDVSLKLPD